MFASLKSILSQLDNVPEWYTPRLFRHQLFKFFVDEADFLIKELQDKLKDSKYSYYEICDRLGRCRKIGDAVHVVLLARALCLI